VARVDLGLSEPEFWRLSWVQFCALGDRLAAAIRREDHRAGVIGALIANQFRSKGPYVKPGDLFDLGEGGRGSAMTPEAMLRVAEIANAAMGGRDRRPARA
jgi:hypothetical protein